MQRVGVGHHLYAPGACAQWRAHRIAGRNLPGPGLFFTTPSPPDTSCQLRCRPLLSLKNPTFARLLSPPPDAPHFLLNNLARSIVFDVGISL
ncbi:hypothetical protein GIW54_21690, partial [Pseudomonas proteolytica]|nr:hypothetical protein [Pseudomonas proteolytica]